MRIDRRTDIAVLPQPHLSPFSHTELHDLAREAFRRAIPEVLSEMTSGRRPPNYFVERVYDQAIDHFEALTVPVGIVKSDYQKWQGQIRFEARGMYEYPAYFLLMHGKLCMRWQKPYFRIRRGEMTNDAILHHNLMLSSQQPLPEWQAKNLDEKWKNYFFVWDVEENYRGDAVIREYVLRLVLATAPLRSGGRVLRPEDFAEIDRQEIDRLGVSVKPQSSLRPEGTYTEPEVKEKDGTIL